MGRAYEVRKASIQKTGAARGKIYSMYAREIYDVAKKGGTDPASNASLKRLMEKAKKEQVPADIIKRAIDKVNSGADETYEPMCGNCFVDKVLLPYSKDFQIFEKNKIKVLQK